MANSLRVGIIGTGRAGRCQARAFGLLPGVSVTALWNRSRAKAERLAADLKTPELAVFDDWRRMIDRSRVDIVSIATDPVLRLELFAYALAKGRHVLVEKPLAWDLPEAEAMARAAGEAETVTAISFNWRYSTVQRVAGDPETVPGQGSVYPGSGRRGPPAGGGFVGAAHLEPADCRLCISRSQ